ncbi:MAG: hypothetical protein BGO43_12610 [Gammaproteobacteria bacterium 39-13]|nr:hypothetical protein [Gammaproteobacteria bacterium]OJV89989.1 MAG: hypothetical protein BGO43_12610 [Gammaproteobacteria bacterium 39-13]
MARSKKTSPKKKAPLKASTKRPAKKAASSKKEDGKLQLNFTNSLKNLKSFWDKQVIDLKKQIDTLKQKTNKASINSKRTKTATTTASQEKLKALREKLTAAKASASKYAAMSKMITQFERDWAKNPIDAKAKSLSTQNTNTKEEASEIKIAMEPKPKYKDKKSEMAAPLLMEDEDVNRFDETALEEEMDEDLEDIFMPQDDLSEFEVIEDFNTDLDEDNYDDYS